MPLKVAIIEDEPAIARSLQYALKEAHASIEVMKMLDSVAIASEWLQLHSSSCDLLFMDIQLNDGLSFEIFGRVKIEVPVIFITAFNHYALQAFKTNGIDYILKPFDQIELEQALAKFAMLKGNATQGTADKLQQVGEQIRSSTQQYRQSFLVHFRDKLVPLTADDIAWFTTINETVYAQTNDNRNYTVDFTLEQLQQQLNPQQFFRANRQFIINQKSINEIEFYFNGRLLVNVQPQPAERILVSKARVPEFRQWMNG